MNFVSFGAGPVKLFLQVSSLNPKLRQPAAGVSFGFTIQTLNWYWLSTFYLTARKPLSVSLKCQTILLLRCISFQIKDALREWGACCLKGTQVNSAQLSKYQAQVFSEQNWSDWINTSNYVFFLFSSYYFNCLKCQSGVCHMPHCYVKNNFPTTDHLLTIQVD